MRPPRFRIRTLMIAALGVALYCAGLVRGPVWLVVALVLLPLLSPVAIAITYLVSRWGRKTLLSVARACPNPK